MIKLPDDIRQQYNLPSGWACWTSCSKIVLQPTASTVTITTPPPLLPVVSAPRADVYPELFAMTTAAQQPQITNTVPDVTSAYTFAENSADTVDMFKVPSSPATREQLNPITTFAETEDENVPVQSIESHIVSENVPSTADATSYSDILASSTHASLVSLFTDNTDGDTLNKDTYAEDQTSDFSPSTCDHSASIGTFYHSHPDIAHGADELRYSALTYSHPEHHGYDLVALLNSSNLVQAP